jgi:hypothetical protein
MNLGQLAGLVIFVLLFGVASHSLTNLAFADELATRDKSQAIGGTDWYKTNLNVPKDPSVKAKVKEALEKQEAAIKHLKEMATSKIKGYAEISVDVSNTTKNKNCHKSC